MNKMDKKSKQNGVLLNTNYMQGMRRVLAVVTPANSGTGKRRSNVYVKENNMNEEDMRRMEKGINNNTKRMEKEQVPTPATYTRERRLGSHSQDKRQGPKRHTTNQHQHPHCRQRRNEGKACQSHKNGREPNREMKRKLSVSTKTSITKRQPPITDKGEIKTRFGNDTPDEEHTNTKQR